MKKNIVPAIKLTAVLIVFLAVIYPLAVWGVAQFAPNGGKGEIIEFNGQKYYANIEQTFDQDQYFWSRPSAVDYDGGGSGGSNKGASNPEYLAQVQARIDTFAKHNPDIQRSEIPVDMVTASGSGLDPNISIQGAKVQVKRIAKIRNIDESTLNRLIEENTEKPFLGIFGPSKINVLKLNIALDQLKK
ncbi:K(+)-transporting ATPase subunit C [Ornithobacterium rhinotracheale]|uniref:K(+)-transporting ATPase subunit C n=1 Tax=Ornithobacterium rhinotracheale TaxID=28251 RepID=UPI00129D1B2D|nr:K(+)-transporting ATPase subunit C [Ornithobacterium rhinotracheale]MRJ07917.1 K(+)-transporting ATPase subunit C [Ornithobacterium rhinotracheale]UOH78571.1 K(+)-transporting ATPase subunit C [Ornithobacterium rhinotracheale]